MKYYVYWLFCMLLLYKSYEVGRRFVHYDINECFSDKPKGTSADLYRCVIEKEVKRKNR